ncbi:MAG: type II toxin-antitoxin system RelE/ParE family toxin [Dehalogenimonas sp.]|uniref:Type II toxin-antitoxin system RelE/ParE family toxin n=1 Tax=Candidatus Dehalogenimonas loeffleri TaxID=3127115 RepID=A0ABZ2J8L3_9CHLR|nr:type II toxin-antitoxin system RelE/ParE family toxin [Dehalogenimonas sp.]
MEWTPIFYTDVNGNQPVKDFILCQSDSAIAEILHNLKLLRLFNIQLEMPISKKINSKIRELRIHHGSDYFRILYSAIPEKQFLLLHGILKKTDKLNEQAIETAEKRLADYIERWS